MSPPTLPYDLYSQIVRAAIQRRHPYTFSEDETDDLAANRRLLYKLCFVNRDFRTIAQSLLFAEAVFQNTNVFPRDPKEEERPFAYFDSIESNEALGAHVRHILVQNGSAQISSYILSYLHLLPNLKRLSTLCWHLDLPLPEDVLNFPLRKPTPHCITIDVGRFASASYNIIVGKWFDFAQLRKLHLRNAHHIDFVLDAILPLLVGATNLTDLRIDGFGTTSHEEDAIMKALKQVGSGLTTLHLQSLGTPARLNPEILELCPQLVQLSTAVADISTFLAAPAKHDTLETLLLGHIPRPFKPTARTLQANSAALAQAVEQLLPVYTTGHFPALRFVGSGGLDFGMLGNKGAASDDDEGSLMAAVWDEVVQTAGRLRQVGLGVLDRYGESLEEMPALAAAVAEQAATP